MQFINLTPHTIRLSAGGKFITLEPTKIAKLGRVVLRVRNVKDSHKSILGVRVKCVTPQPYWAYIAEDGTVTPHEGSRMPRLYMSPQRGKIKYIVSRMTLLACRGVFDGVQCLAPAGLRRVKGVLVASHLITY